MKHSLVVLAALALIAMPANAQDAKETAPTFAPAPGSSAIHGPAIDVPELELPEPGSFTGAVCDTCPGQAGCTISDGIPVAGDTTGNTASAAGVTGACGPDAAIIDAFYTYEPSCTGIATATGVTAGGPAFVMAHNTTPNGCNVLIACDDTGAGISFSVFVADTFQLRIGNAAEGTYTLGVTCAPSVCDNGVIEPGEDCDPSAPPPNDLCANGDACPADCQCAGCPASELNDCDGTLSQSTSTDVTIPEMSISCSAGQGGVPDSQWARCFRKSVEGWTNVIVVDSVTFEVTAALDGTDVCINLYEIDSCDNIAGTPVTNPLPVLATACTVVNAVDVQTLVTIDFPGGVKVAEPSDLIIEIDHVITSLGIFTAAQNTAPECDVSCIRALTCGLVNWTPLGNIGFPDSHLNLTASVSCNEPGEEIPTVSEWGMIALTLLLLAVAGRMIVRRRRLA